MKRRTHAMFRPSSGVRALVPALALVLAQCADPGRPAENSEVKSQPASGILTTRPVILPITLSFLSSGAKDQNDVGMTVGYEFNRDDGNVPVLWVRDQVIRLPGLGSARAGEAMAVNEDGQIVGTSGGAAVMWAGDSVIQLEPFGVFGADAFGVNESGQVAGQGFDAVSGAQTPVVWTDLRHVLALAPSIPGQALGINDHGEVVGWVSDDFGSLPRAVMWSSSGALIDITPTGGFGIAYGLNNHGVVVGHIGSPGHCLEAFRWTAAEGVAYILDDVPNIECGSSVAFDVNDSGVIVGAFVDSTTDIKHAFRWTPDGGFVDLGGNQANAVTECGNIVGLGATRGSRAVVWPKKGCRPPQP